MSNRRCLRDQLELLSCIASAQNCLVRGWQPRCLPQPETSRPEHLACQIKSTPICRSRFRELTNPPTVPHGGGGGSATTSPYAFRNPRSRAEQTAERRLTCCFRRQSSTASFAMAALTTTTSGSRTEIGRASCRERVLVTV